MADVSVGVVRLLVVGTHLDGVDERRLRHITELHQAIDAFPITSVIPCVIGVDVNAEAGSRSWRRSTEHALDAAAVTSFGDPRPNQPRTPTRRIDAFFVSGNVAVSSTRARDFADVNIASDAPSGRLRARSNANRPQKAAATDPPPGTTPQ